MPTSDGPVALLGDAHLRAGDPEVDAFIRFLENFPREIGTLAILGDLFAVWIGTADLALDHHRRVLEALRRLKKRGCRLLYVEGNHDFFLRRLYAGDPFDSLAEDALDLALAGRRIHLAHGDLVNRRDRRYLLWRRVTKNGAFFGAFSALPAALKTRLADRIEASLARTNMEHRRGFPLAECEEYARRRIGEGSDLIVFGHFHEERRIDCTGGERRGAVYVLPAWRDGHRYLRVDPYAEPAFVSS